MIRIARSWEKPVTSEVIAESESVSKKYLDGILGTLRRGGLLISFKGQGGGYVLARPPAEITAADVVGLLEGGLEVIACIREPDTCDKKGNCVAREVWHSVSAAVSDTLGDLSLEELAAREPGTGQGRTKYNN